MKCELWCVSRELWMNVQCVSCDVRRTMSCELNACHIVDRGRVESVKDWRILRCRRHSRQSSRHCFMASNGDISTLLLGPTWTGAQPDFHTELCLDKVTKAACCVSVYLCVCVCVCVLQCTSSPVITSPHFCPSLYVFSRRLKVMDWFSWNFELVKLIMELDFWWSHHTGNLGEYLPF